MDTLIAHDHLVFNYKLARVSNPDGQRLGAIRQWWADDSLERRPTFLVVSLRINGPWLRPLLRHNDEVGPTLRWTWYLRKSAGPVALDRARRANAAAMAGG